MMNHVRPFSLQSSSPLILIREPQPSQTHMRTEKGNVVIDDSILFLRTEALKCMFTYQSAAGCMYSLSVVEFERF